MMSVENIDLAKLGYSCNYTVDVLDVDETKITGDIYLPADGTLFTKITVYWNFDDLICRNILKDKGLPFTILSQDLVELSPEKHRIYKYFVCNKNNFNLNMKYDTLKEARNEAIRLTKQPKNIGDEIYVMSIHDIYKSELQIKKVI